MTRTEVTCLVCGGRIHYHWQLILLHATCKPPVVERAAQAMGAPPGQEGAALTWCRDCNMYHLNPHPPIGRHVKRAVTKLLRGS
jgi:hypothetical protein